MQDDYGQRGRLGRLLLLVAEIAAFLVAGSDAVYQFFEFATHGHTGKAFADPERRRQAWRA